VNHGWLCDKGRFTLESIDGNEESTNPLNAATRITNHWFDETATSSRSVGAKRSAKRPNCCDARRRRPTGSALSAGRP